MQIKPSERANSMEVEYGSPMSFSISFRVHITYAECGSMMRGMHAIRKRFSQQFARLKIDFAADVPNNAPPFFAFEVVGEALNNAIAEDKLFASQRQRVSMTSEKTPLDKYYSFLTVTHEGDPQIVVVDKQIPTLEMMFTGILPDSGQSVIGGGGVINSTPFFGMAAKTTMLAGIDIEPFDAGIAGSESSVRKRRYTFRFLTIMGIWNPTIYYVDPETGRMPQDLVAGTGYREGMVYHEGDFNSMWPFNTYEVVW